MAEEKTEMNKRDKTNEDASLKPDPETLNTTDPQEHMEGPISSIVQSVKENVEESGGEKNDEDEKNS